MPFGRDFNLLDDEEPLELQAPGDAFQQWQQKPTPESASRLLGHLQPTIDKAISAHVGTPTSHLRSQGRKLALQAAKTFDPTKGAKLETHVMNQLQGLKRIARRQEQIAQMPERLVLEQRQLHRSALDLEEQLGREPSTAELSAHTGLSPRRIAHVRSMQLPQAEGSIMGQQDGELTSLQPSVQYDTSGAWHELVYDDLPPVQQQVMEWSLGMFGSPRLSNDQIAARLRLSPGRISQLKQQIQRQLDRQDLNPF